MAMEVDQARGDQLAGRVKYPGGSPRVDRGFDRSNLPEADTDITLARKSLTGV